MALVQRELTIATSGRGFYEFTDQLRALVSEAAMQGGLCHCFIHHTSASMVIMENADPDVLRDLETHMSGLVQDGDPRFVHTAEGPDDMSAHVRSALTHTSLSIPLRRGRLDLGTWQGVFVWEHRTSPHRRRLTVTLLPAEPG
ncbi:MAG: secondary thiamine-phosphate synthase enzyme YjbQ [Xanthomonadales bacterium]|nr:secondary thiamine-phosphate synthase enzyme YjbQ [Xanthomonadales bacterium]